MQKYKSLFNFVSTVFSLAITGQCAKAFTINQAPVGSNNSFAFYNKGDTHGFTWLRYANPVDRNGNEETDLLDLLNDFVQTRGGNWQFNFARDSNGNLRNLQGSFDLEYYYACGAEKEECGFERFGGDALTTGVGASIILQYSPVGNDPKLSPLSSLFWIQRVKSNHALYPADEHEFEENRLDDIRDGSTNPYYSPARAGLFGDTPYRIDAENDHEWDAELYLAEEMINSGIRQVTIYNGMEWGWRNKVAKKFKQFVDSLSSNQEEDKFQLSELTPGAKFYAYINNDIPGNICNPNTILGAYDNYGVLINGDNDSSHIGDGFASALTGTVSSNGTIELRVSSGAGFNGLNRRGQDRGNYELNIMMFDNEDLPFVVGSSGGGGVVSSSGGGGVQQNPILPNRTEQGWQVFRNVPGCRWYDPHTPYGFEFQALDDTLFTEILDFPVGDDNQFTVSVGDRILGEFGAGDRVDFTSLFGSGISNFKITGIDSLLGSTEETAFPIQLAFNDRTGSFKMRPFSQESSPASVPESTSALGLLALGAWGIIKAMKIRLEK